MNVPENLLYTNDHEWVKIEGGAGIVGITEYAQRELGDIVFVDVDAELAEVTAGGSFGTIEAVKTVSELFAPLTGKVLAVNSKLADEPQLINSDPYGEGWIIKIQIADMTEADALLKVEDYKPLIGL